MFRLILSVTIPAICYRKRAQYMPFDLLRVTNVPERIYVFHVVKVEHRSQSMKFINYHLPVFFCPFRVTTRKI